MEFAPMKTRLPISALVATAVLLAGCGSTPEIVCTAIGADPGIAFSISQSHAETTGSAELEVCWGDTCHDAWPEIYKRSDDATELTGFAAIADLPDGDVSVKITLFDAENAEIFSDETTVKTAATYPNGPECPAEGVQGSVSVQETKLVTERP